MKKLWKLALLLCLTPAVFAQVQLGKGVQVGGTGSGATLPTNAITYGTSSTTSRAATATDIKNLVQSSTGCTTSGNFWEPASGTCIPSPGGLTGQTITCAVKAASATTSTSSLPICDDGTTLTITHPTTFNDGSGKAGYFGLKQGTAQSTVTGEIGFTAPTSVTAYNMLWPGAQWTGLLSNNGSGVLSGVSVLPVANGGTGTTTPGIVAGTNVTVTGTWPNQTVNSTGGGGGSLPTATAPGQIISSTTAGTTYAVQPQVFYSQGGDTIASIETECSSACTYVVTAPQTITLSASHAMSSTVTLQFMAGGKWTINGAFTLSNIQISQASELTAHLAGTSTLALSPLVSRVPVEWCGAVGYATNAAASSGPDYTGQIQKCIDALAIGSTLKFQGGLSYQASSGLRVITSGITLEGGPGAGSASANIVSNSATVNILSIDGSGGMIFWDNVDNISLFRMTLPSGTVPTQGVGLFARLVGGLGIHNVYSFDSLDGFYTNGTPTYGIATWVAACTNGQFSVNTYTTQVLNCFDIDSSNGVGEGTLSIQGVFATAGSALPSGGVVSTAFYVHGLAVNDLDLYSPESSNVSYGVKIVYTGSGNIDTEADIHIISPILEAYVAAVYVSGLSFDTGYPTVVIDGGYLAPTSIAAKALDCENSIGVNVLGAQFIGGGDGVHANNCTALSITGNTFMQVAGIAIDFVNTTSSVVVGNTFSQVGSTNTVSLTGASTANTITANAVRGSATYGFNFSGGSAANELWANTCGTTITFCFTGSAVQGTGWTILSGTYITTPYIPVIAPTGTGDNAIFYLQPNAGDVWYEIATGSSAGAGVNSLAFYNATAGKTPFNIFSHGGVTTLGTYKDGVFGWNSDASYAGPSLDTGLSRCISTANCIAVGNGTAGNTSGTIKAANYGAGALANGMTATTQSPSDNSTKVATTAYVDAREPVTTKTWTVAPTLFATGTMLGGVYYLPNVPPFYASGPFTARLSGTISCSVAPVINVMDLGTSPSTAYGSATSITSLTTGTSDGVYSTTPGTFGLTTGHYIGIAFSSGTCVTAPNFDITVQWGD
jgi:hypothetical protein